MAVHWVLFLWVLCWPTAIIIEESTLYNLPRGTVDFLYIGGILAAVYIVALWIIKGRWIWLPWQNYRGWGEQKLDKLFKAIHWLIFITFCAHFFFFFFSLGMVLLNHLLFREGLLGFLLVIGPVTWIPLAFLLIDWIVNGKWTWFPWNRKRNK